MKFKNCYILLLMLLAGGATSVQGQTGNTGAATSDAGLMAQRYTSSYDSLLNSFYLKRYPRSRHARGGEFNVEEFDAIPDSVLAARLRSLHTVVPMTYNSEVRAHIRFYLRVMSRRLSLTLLQKEQYFPIFVEALDRYGVPEELKYLTIVESALNPMATSRVGAAGLWQFMYNTGKLYGLEVNSVVDERRDPYKSSQAAARFLADLYRVFHDWELAIAAYNCGPGNINKAIARSGGERNFWKIYPFLPRETRGYVPAFIAVTYVMKYYPEHGLRPEKLNLPLRSDTIDLSSDVLFHYVEQFTGVDSAELRTLNPQYRADVIPASSGHYHLALPTSLVPTFIANQDSIYRHSADSLSRRPLKIEPHKSAKRGKSNAKSSSGSGRYHVVKKGDTLFNIAKRYGLTVNQLKSMNGLRKDSIKMGQRLKVR